MANVIIRKEKIGRPIRFKQRSLEAVFTKFIFIRINQVGVRMGLQKFHNLKKRVGFDDVIMIEERDPLPASKRESLIRLCRDSFMFLEAFQNNTSIAGGQNRQRPKQIGVARSIVDQHELPVFVCWREHPLKRSLKPLHGRVEDRRDYTNQGLRSKRT